MNNLYSNNNLDNNLRLLLRSRYSVKTLFLLNYIPPRAVSSIFQPGRQDKCYQLTFMQTTDSVRDIEPRDIFRKTWRRFPAIFVAPKHDVYSTSDPVAFVPKPNQSPELILAKYVSAKLKISSNQMFLYVASQRLLRLNYL